VYGYMTMQNLGTTSREKSGALLGAGGLLEAVPVARPAREREPVIPGPAIAIVRAAVLVEDLALIPGDDYLLAPVRRRDARRGVGVLAEQGVDRADVDPRGDRPLARRERDPALVLTPDAAVFVVGTGTPPAAGVDPVGAAILADDLEDVAALGEDRHALGESAGVPVVEFGTFVTVEFLVRHGFSLQETPRLGRPRARALPKRPKEPVCLYHIV
jgi:hypothetical protein